MPLPTTSWIWNYCRLFDHWQWSGHLITANSSNKKFLSKVADNKVKNSGNFLAHKYQKHKSGMKDWFIIWRLSNVLHHIKDKEWKQETWSHTGGVHKENQLLDNLGFHGPSRANGRRKKCIKNSLESSALPCWSRQVRLKEYCQGTISSQTHSSSMVASMLMPF